MGKDSTHDVTGHSAPHTTAAHSEVPPEELAKYYVRAQTQKTSEYPRWPSTYSGAGVIPMELVGRFGHERERLGPDFTAADRKWRVQWIRDQKLHPAEPFEVKQLYHEYNNIFRRIYKAPMNFVEQNLLCPLMGKNRAYVSRKLIGRFTEIYVGALVLYYWIKYNPQSWEKAMGWRVQLQKEPLYPGEQKYRQRQESYEYFHLGFNNRKVFRD